MLQDVVPVWLAQCVCVTWLRSALEKLSRGRVVRRRFSSDFGRQLLFVTPDSRLRYWRWDLDSVDPHLLAAARNLVRPGDSVWDIGANCGLFSFAAAYVAGAAGRVIAVEPDTFLATNLTRSNDVRSSDIADVMVLPCAVSNVLGIAQLHIAARGRSSNSLGQGRSQAGGFRTSQATVVVTLDWIAEHCPPPDVVKVDVEGLETDVLYGGLDLLTAKRPTLYIEVGKEQAGEVSRLLSELGYRMYDSADLTAEINEAAYNTVAIHKSR